MTKSQRRAMYLEAARAVLEEGEFGIYLPCDNLGGGCDLPELDFLTDGVSSDRRVNATADERAMLLILAATI